MLNEITIDLKFPKNSWCQPSFNSHELITNSEKYSLADSALNVNGSKKEGNEITWYEIETRFSDNFRQKETVDDIILANFRINM